MLSPLPIFPKFRTLFLCSISVFAAAIHASTIDLSSMDETAEGFSNIKTVQVAYQDEVVWSKAYNNADINAVTNIKSASKSLMLAIVGMAIDRGVLEGVDQSVTMLLPDQLPQKPDPRLKEITLGHLLSMQAGLERTCGRTGYRDSLHRMLSEDIIPAIQAAL
jgi:CubicO group peptidase (beta-lactamase class C family)